MPKRSLLLLPIILFIFTQIALAVEPAVLYERANEAFVKRRFKEAEELFQKYLVLFPDGEERVKAQYFIGEARYQLAEFEKAVTAFQRVIDRYADNPLAIEAQNRIGDSYQRLNQPEKAIEAYREVIREHPNTRQANYANYSISWLKSPDLKVEPKRRFSSEVQLQLAKEAFTRKEYERSKYEFENFLMGFPEDKMAPYARLKMAECDYHLGRYKEAISNYQKVLSDYPQNPYQDYAQYSIVWCYYRLKDYDKALAAFEKTKKDFPKSRYLASLEELLPDIEKKAGIKAAEDLYKAGIKAAEDLYKEAQDNYEKGNLVLASQKFEKLINEYPESPHAQEARQKLLMIKEAIYPRAKRLYREASRLREGGDYEGAIERFRGVISRYPSSEHAKLASRSLALIVKEMIEAEAAGLWTEAEKAVTEERYEAARDLYGEIIDRYPTSSFSRKARSRVKEILLAFEDKEAKKVYQQALAYLKEEKLHRAIREFEKIILTFPHSEYAEPAKKGIARAKEALFELQAERQYELANEYYRLKDYDKALDEFHKVVAGYPKTTYARKAKAAIDEIARIFFDREAEEVYNLARRYYSEGSLDKSFKEFQRLIDNYPESEYRQAAAEAMVKISKQMVNEAAKELYDRGRGYQKNEDYTQAIGEYEALLKRYPFSYWAPYAQYAKAESFYIDQADYRRAQAEWTKVVDNFPTHELAPHALYHIGECFEKLKEWDRARATYKRLVEEYPQSIYGQGELAQFIRTFLASSGERIRD